MKSIKTVKRDTEFTFFCLGIIFTFCLLSLKDYMNLSIRNAILILLVFLFSTKMIIKFLKNSGRKGAL